MTRDRLSALKAISGDEPEVCLRLHESDNSLKKFFEEVVFIEELIESIQSNIDEVRKVHGILLGLSQDDEKAKKRCEELMTIIKKSANSIRVKLKEMQLKNEKSSTKDSAEYRIKQVQHSNLSHKFMDVMNDYNSIQTEYREKCKSRLQRMLEVTERSVTSQELEEMLETENVDIFTQGYIPQTQQERQALADIAARHADIMKLEKSIRELHDLFTEMASMTERQGEMLDRIEHHVRNTKEYIEKGKQQVDDARVNQRQARNKKIYIIICLAIILAIGISTLFFT